MSKPSPAQEWRLLLGVEPSKTSHREKWISALGAAIGIAFVLVCTRWVVGDREHAALIVASMGATAVLVFAVPHGALSQPWAVLGGQVLSAGVGVGCRLLIANPVWAAAIAVGAAIGVMHYARCIHPPGGATALAAVIGGPQVDALGFAYALTPVLVNVAAILVVAVAFNGLFGWRRYPAHLSRHLSAATVVGPAERHYELTHADFAAAMRQMDSYVDITMEDIAQLLELANEHAERTVLHPARIAAGRVYSNGRIGGLWSVRDVLEASDGGTGPSADVVRYRVVAGDGAGATASCLRGEFRAWARFEVERRDDGLWTKVMPFPGT